MGEIEENWQPTKFYCSEIKLIYSSSDYTIYKLHNTIASICIHRKSNRLVIVLHAIQKLNQLLGVNLCHVIT